MSREVVVDILNLLRKLIRKNKVLVVYATNNLNEVEELADKILFLYEGKQVFYGSIDEFRNIFRKFTVKIEYTDGNKFSILANEEEIYSILSDIISTRKKFKILKISPPSIEDVYLYTIRGGIKRGL